MQPRVGLTWDFTRQGKGKLFINYARYLETPIPLDFNIRAGSNGVQTDKNFNVDRLNAAAGSNIIPGIRGNLAVGLTNLGSTPTPVDVGLKPQTVNEATAGLEYEVAKDITIGARGIYRAQGSVIELDALAGEPMDVLVNGCLIAQGEVVVVNEKFGIRLTDIITPSERMRKLHR